MNKKPSNHLEAMAVSNTQRAIRLLASDIFLPEDTCADLRRDAETGYNGLQDFLTEEDHTLYEKAAKRHHLKGDRHGRLGESG